MEMPKIYVNPPRSEWPALTARCTRQEEEIGERVAAILAEVCTGGWARAYSGVNTESFMRKITYQELTRGGLEALAPTITAMAEAEGLDAHANAVRIRTEGGAR